MAQPVQLASERRESARYTYETDGRGLAATRARCGWVLALLLALLIPLPGGPGRDRAHAQGSRTEGQAAGSISGRVVDAETLVPLEGARVRLERAAGAAADGSDPPLRTALTDRAGAYRFGALPGARYRVRVERIGYLPRSLEVELQRSGEATLSIGMEIQPIRLPEIEVVGATAQPFERTREPEAEIVGARAEVARLRQLAYLATDARELTHGELVEAVTLGEPDLFRALQRVPGVATRDDYTATLWTRGATWDQTRVYFDGLQLYNPTHAGWLFSAVNPDAIGSVLFLPGYRSSRWGEGAAAILDLRSRSGTAGDSFGGTAELSPASLRVALDGEAAGGQLRWMAAGRRTYVDVLSGLAGAVTGDDDLRVPYDFSDLVFRVDGRSDDGWGFELSSILERDHLRGDIAGIVQGNRGRWGNRAGQVTLKAPVRPFGPFGPLEARISAGQTLFGTRLEADSLGPGEVRSTQLPSLRNDVRHHAFGVQVQPAGPDSLRWAVGFQQVRDAIHYAGPLSILDVVVTPDSVSLDREYTREYTDLLAYSALWGERRWGLGDRVEIETGARLEFGDSVYNGGRLRVSPRVAARAALTPNTLLSAGWSRTYQYTQDVAPAAGPVGPQLHLSAVWIAASIFRAYPAARADVATVGLERWIGSEWLAGVNGYHRRGTGHLVANPDTGTVFQDRDPDAVASGTAAGLELSLRKLTGRWTGSIGYTFGSSRMQSVVERATGDTVHYDFVSPADVPHAVDLTGMVNLGEGVRVGGAFTFGAGVPFTRLVLPDTTRPAAERDDPRLELPNAERTRSYASLDLMVEYSRSWGPWRISAYGQLRNALARDNAVTYLGSRACGAGPVLESVGSDPIECRNPAAGETVRDIFREGLPMLPLFGVRVAF